MKPDELGPLIDRAKQRDPGAFDALVDAYGRRLYGYIYRLTGSRLDAEDLLGELFVRLVRTIDQYQHDGRFEAWIFRIATNLARDHVRRNRRAPATVSIDAETAAGPDDGDPPAWRELADISGPPPDASLELREEVDDLQRALAQLPAAEREVIMLRHFSGLSFADIAEAMGTPLGTALARSHRGLQRLRELLEDRP